MATSCPLQLSDVHVQWHLHRTAPLLPSTIPSSKDQLPSLLDQVAISFPALNDHQQATAMKELANLSQQVPEVLTEPSSVRVKGRPRKNDYSTRRNPSGFEYVDPPSKSIKQKRRKVTCTACNQVGHRRDSRKCPQAIGEQNRAKTESDAEQITLEKQTFVPPPSLSDLPVDHLQLGVEIFMDVEGDGNCGFRALAVALGFGEKCWFLVRNDMVLHMQEHASYYEKTFGDLRCRKLLSSIGTCDSPAATEDWFTVPYHCIIAANTYMQPVILFEEHAAFAGTSQMFVPDKMEIEKTMPLALLYKNSHFKGVTKLTDDCALPPIPETLFPIPDTDYTISDLSSWRSYFANRLAAWPDSQEIARKHNRKYGKFVEDKDPSAAIKIE